MIRSNAIAMDIEIDTKSCYKCLHALIKHNDKVFCSSNEHNIFLVKESLVDGCNCDVYEEIKGGCVKWLK